MQVHNLRDCGLTLAIMKAKKESRAFSYIGISSSREDLHDGLLRVMRRQPMDFVHINYGRGEPRGAERTLPLMCSFAPMPCKGGG